MPVKQSEYKLDFKYKPVGSSRFYYLRNCVLKEGAWGHNLYSYERRYNTWARESYLAKIFEEYKDKKELWSYLDPKDLNYDKMEFKYDPQLKETVVAQAASLVSHGDLFNHPDKSIMDGRAVNFYFDALQKAILKTPKYAALTAAFDKWLLRRKGLVNAFKKFVEKANKKTLEANEKSLLTYGSPAYSQPLLTDELTLQNFASIVDTRSFARHLENSRPTKFPAGTVVQLKRMYHYKRAQDPYFYHGQSVTSERRIGVVQKTDATYTTYGSGSRPLRIMWFLTGNETEVMERCIEVVTDDAANQPPQT